MSRISLLMVVLAAAGLSISVSSTAPRFEVPAPPRSLNELNKFIVELRLIEIDRKKMRQLGMDFAKRDGSGSKYVEAGLLDLADTTQGIGTVASADVLKLVESLRKNGVVRILAEPDLGLVEGHEARFSVGKTIDAPYWEDPIEGKDRAFVGTRLNLRASLLEKGKADLNIRLRVTGLEEPISETTAQPHISVSEYDTGFAVALGETMIVPGDPRQIRCIAKANAVAGSSGSVKCERVEEVIEDKMSYLLVKATLVDEKLASELNARLDPSTRYGVVEAAILR